MKSMKLVWIFLFLVLQGCQQIPPRSPNKTNLKGVKEGRWTILYDGNLNEISNLDSIKYYRIITFENGRPSGIVKDYYKSGKIHWEWRLKSINPDIHEDGIISEYFENGKLSQQGNLKNNEKHGWWKEYDTDGNCWKGIYLNGKKEGKWVGLYLNGGKKQEEFFINGKMDGLCIEWYKNGKESCRGEFKDGIKEGLSKIYFENGKIECEGKYLHDVKDGLWKEYDSTGRWYEGNYTQGRFDRNWTRRYPNGNIEVEFSVVNEKKEGRWNEYYLNGKKKVEGFYVNDKKSGTWTKWSEDGKISEKRSY